MQWRPTLIVLATGAIALAVSAVATWFLVVKLKADLTDALIAAGAIVTGLATAFYASLTWLLVRVERDSIQLATRTERRRALPMVDVLPPALDSARGEYYTTVNNRTREHALDVRLTVDGIGSTGQTFHIEQGSWPAIPPGEGWNPRWVVPDGPPHEMTLTVSHSGKLGGSIVQVHRASDDAWERLSLDVHDE